jgi:DNA adenine methylase
MIMTKTLSPLRYPGGKSKFYPDVKKILEINNLIGGTYIEPFAGGAGIALKLLINRDVDKIIINDVDPAIFAFWYSILNFTEDFCRLISKTRISIRQWRIQREIYRKLDTTDLLELGFSTFFLNRTNVSGVLKGGIIGGLKQDGKYQIDARFNKKGLIAKINNLAQYKEKMVLLNIDAFDLLNSEEFKKAKKTFVNFDPPYVNKGSRLYKNSFLEDDHRELASAIKKCFKKWIVTYDVCPIITELYSSYRRSYLDVNYSVNTKRRSKEYIIFSKNLIIPDDVILESQ